MLKGIEQLALRQVYVAGETRDLLTPNSWMYADEE
jgi:hypothetical protein